MEKFKPRHNSADEAISTPRLLDDRIRSSLDRNFHWELGSEPEAEFSFDEIVSMLVQDPQLIGPAKRYLAEARWAQEDGEASESALQRLAWALVEKLAKVQI